MFWLCTTFVLNINFWNVNLYNLIFNIVCLTASSQNSWKFNTWLSWAFGAGSSVSLRLEVDENPFIRRPLVFGALMASAVVTVGKVIYFRKLKSHSQLQGQNKLGLDLAETRSWVRLPQESQESRGSCFWRKDPRCRVQGCSLYWGMLISWWAWVCKFLRQHGFCIHSFSTLACLYVPSPLS